MRFVDIEQVEPPDFVFLALPAAPSIEVAARFLDAGSRVIDLGSAFRLRDRATWESVYGQAHGRWDLASGGAWSSSAFWTVWAREALRRCGEPEPDGRHGSYGRSGPPWLPSQMSRSFI
ncbi:MAG TPA: hypothetical protein ENH54_00710 [Actinobacteria bacterium]|nr:hypothetical protein [Actinomycetota bacterium]